MEDAPIRIRQLGIALGAVALWLAGMWLAAQGGLWPAPVAEASSAQVALAVLGKLAGVLFILLGALPVLVSFWIGAAGLGWLIRRRLVPQAQYGLFVQLGAGLAALLCLDWLTGWAGLLNTWTAWMVCAIGAGVVAWHIADVRRQAWQLDHWPTPPWTLLLGLPVGGLYLVAAMCPPGTLWTVEALAYDVQSYHLQLPREWLADGAMRGLHHNVYSYLPNLVEAGYMHLGAMYGGMSGSAIYTTQLVHAGCAMLAAAALACVVSRFVGRAAGVVAGVALLLVPWTLITGTLAYDEMAALAILGAALLLTFDHVAATYKGALLIGLLLGAVTLAKLTIGAMLTPGLLVVLALGWHHAPPWRERLGTGRRLALAGVAALGVVLIVTPYLVRNASWTGNPVFPLAAQTLGDGHWTPGQVARWQAAHGQGESTIDGLRLLGPRWLLSQGYGAVLGSGPSAKTTIDSRDITRFAGDNGLPLFWLAAALGAGLSLTFAPLRRVTLAMLILLASCLIVWLIATHHQSRFLLPTAVPGAALIGLGMGRLETLTRRRMPRLAPALAVAILSAMTLNTYDVFFHQTPVVAGIPGRLMPYQLVDSLPTQPDATLVRQNGSTIGDHIINYLPANRRTLLIAESRVLYIRAPIVYHSAFDADLLGELINRHHGDPAAVTAGLRRAGITHVWIDWSELTRLRETYGYALDAPLDRLRGVAQRHWTTVADYGRATLYALPPE
ncbi:MAG: hypothetical protein WEC36_02425 [Phycisphaeraceae bacterium]